MSPADYLSLAFFVVATAGSPGPNNVMIMTSGANHGWRRSIPHLVGINIGFPLMIVVVGVGLGGLVVTSPVFHRILQPIGVLYLLYLAWRIAAAPVEVSGTASSRPLSLLQAAAFQWVNPKAWVMALGAIATYTVADGGYAWQVLVIAAAFMVLSTPCTGGWLWLGIALGQILHSPRRLRTFNVLMAVLLVASVVPVTWQLAHTALR
ncbi:MAG: LysE family translocator [Pseudonocardia sp.]